MYKVNNKKAIRNIAVKSFLANKTRNIVAIIAIALTALMFTSVVTIGLSIVDSIQQSYMRQVGTSLHGGYKNLTQEFYEKVESDSKISDIAMRIIIGGIKNEELTKLHTEMSYVDENYAKTSFLEPAIGRLPQQFNEILIADSILKALDVPVEIGEEVTLKFRTNGIDREDVFIVSGIYEVDPALNVSQVITSYEYAVSVAPVWAGDDVRAYLEKMSDDYSFVAGSIAANFNFPTSFNIEGQMDALNERMGFDMLLVDDGINWAYMNSEIDVTSMALLAMLLIIITSSGYLIIYNIFLISVSSDVKFYGLLKTIGTTSKQLKKIVRLQALMLSCIGVPLGLILGYFVGASLMPAIVGTSTIDDVVISINPLIFLVAAVFSIITVQISCNKPCRFIAKLSPIEAVRHTNVGKKLKSAKRTKKVTTFNMALANIKRNKLKTTLVIISLSLSALIFNGTYTFVNGLDMDSYLSYFVIDDFFVTSADLLNLGATRTTDAITPQFVEEISNLDGVEQVSSVYLTETVHKLTQSAKENVELAVEEYNEKDPMYLTQALEMLENAEIRTFIYGVSENLFDKIVTKSNDVHAINYLTEEQAELFATGNYVLTTGYYGAAFPEETYYRKGEKVVIDFENGNTKEYEVLDAGMLPYSLDKRFGGAIDVYFILPESEFKAQIPDRNAMNITISAKEESVPKVEEFIANYTQNIDPLLDYESKALFIKEFENLKNTFSITGYTLSFILGFIGIMNFINTMVTSVSSRKLELAMLQSLGLTGGQMKKMLIYEGLFFGATVILFLTTLGAVLTYFIVGMASSSMLNANYTFELVPLLIIAAILGVISLTTPIIIYNNVKTKSVVERLREIG